MFLSISNPSVRLSSHLSLTSNKTSIKRGMKLKKLANNKTTRRDIHSLFFTQITSIEKCLIVRSLQTVYRTISLFLFFNPCFWDYLKICLNLIKKKRKRDIWWRMQISLLLKCSPLLISILCIDLIFFFHYLFVQRVLRWWEGKVLRWWAGEGG